MRKEKEEMDFLFYIVCQRQKIKHLPFMDKIKPFDNFPIKLVLCRKHQTIRRLGFPNHNYTNPSIASLSPIDN